MGGNKNPGPNTYDIPQRAVEGPKFHMGLKLDNQSAIGTHQRKTKGNPGAGKYQPDYTVTKKKLPAFSMLSRHADAQKMRSPGPGTYESKMNKKSAPLFSFGSAAQRDGGIQSIAPGPGNYHIPCSIGDLPAYTGARSKMSVI